MRLLELIEDTVSSGSGYNRYSDHFFDVVENLWRKGKPVTDIMQASPDAELHLEDEEFDYDWRLVMVPLSIFPNYDFPESPEDTERRNNYIRQNPSIFRDRPLLIGLNYKTGILPLYDGHHRVVTAKELGMTHLPALIGVPHGSLNEIVNVGDYEDVASMDGIDISTADKLATLGHGIDLYREAEQFYFVNGDTVLGDVTVSHSHPGFMQKFGMYASIDHIWMNPSIRDKGLGTRFYKFLLDNLKWVVVSDGYQSPTAQSVWWKLLGEYQAVIIDDNDISDHIATPDELTDVWDSDEHTLIALLPKGRSWGRGITEDEGEFDWTKPTTFYRGIVDPRHAKEPFSGTRRGIPTFTDDWAVANTYAQSPNNIQNDKGKSDQVYAYRLNIKHPLKLFDNVREDVTEANYILRQLGATTVGEAWSLFKKLMDVPSWRSDGDTWYTDGGDIFPVEIEGWGDNPTDVYENMNQVFVDHWEHDWPGLYCNSYDLADHPLIQKIAKQKGYDGIVMYGHTSVEYSGITDNDFMTGTSYNGLTAMEWRAFDASQIQYIGPVPNKPIHESLDTPTSFNIVIDTNVSVEYEFTIRGRSYRVIYTRLSSSPQTWELSYALILGNYKLRFKPTNNNQKNVWAVYSTVLAVTNDFIKNHPDIEILMISGDTNNKLSKLYDVMTRVLGKKYGIKVSTPKYTIDDETSKTYNFHIKSPVTEIKTIDPYNDDDPNSRIETVYRNYETKTHTVGKLREYYFDVYEDRTKIVGFLINPMNNTPLGYVSWKIVAPKTLSTVTIYLHPEIRKQGIGLALYEWVLSQKWNIITDTEQTKHAQRVWFNLVQKYDATLRKSRGFHDSGDEPLTSMQQFQDVYTTHMYDLVIVHPRKRTTPLVENLSSVKTHSPNEIAKHHGVSIKQILNQLEKGIKVELEHTRDRSEARQIALDHLLELPDYYERLARMERSAGLVEITNDHRAPLYHGTTISQFIQIMQEGKLRTSLDMGRDHGDLYGGISLTRDIRVAWDFATGYMNIGKNPTGVVMEFDQTRLSSRYQIIPYNDHWHQGETELAPEYEERVLTKTPIDVNRYMTKFYMPNSVIDHMMQHSTMSSLLDNELSGMTEQEYLDIITKLSKHPARINGTGIRGSVTETISQSRSTNAMFDQIYDLIRRDGQFARETSTPIDSFIETVQYDYEFQWWETGDPKEIMQTSEFWDGFKNWLRVRYNYVMKSIQLDLVTFPVIVNREMTVTKHWDPSEHGVGLYWAVPRGDIHAFSGKEGEGYQNISLQAIVNKDDINWIDTIRSRMDFMTGDEEAEVQLKPKTSIRVIKIVDRGPAGYKNTQHTKVNLTPGIYPTTTDTMVHENVIMEATPWLRITPTMIDQAKGNKAQMIMEIPIEQFLEMTTSNANQRDEIKQNAKSILYYNKWAKMGHDKDFDARINARNRAAWEREREEYTDVGDFEKEYGSIIMPFLIIQLDDDGRMGKIKGHEGRHRAASALRAGNRTVPVAIIMKAGKNMFPGEYFGTEYMMYSKHLPGFIQNQYDSGLNSTRNWKILRDDMQKSVRRSDQ